MEKEKRDFTPKASRNIRDEHKHTRPWWATILSLLLMKFGPRPWLGRKKRCPKCSSDKWTEISRCRTMDLFDVMDVFVMGGHDSVPYLVKYKCNNCGEEFGFWERGCRFCRMKEKQHKCKSSDWFKLDEDVNFVYVMCKQCKAFIVVDKKRRGSKKL